jgi:arginase
MRAPDEHASARRVETLWKRGVSRVGLPGCVPLRPVSRGDTAQSNGSRDIAESTPVTGFAVIDAPIDSSGRGRGEERAPATLRDAGLLERLGARDAGAVAARIRDPRRDPHTGVIGAGDVRRASAAIASRVRAAVEARERPLVLGGDCTLLLGVFRAMPGGSGLWFVDGHADFFDGESSPTGEAADMDLAILTGHCPPGLLDGGGPLRDPSAVGLLGHRPADLQPRRRPRERPP